MSGHHHNERIPPVLIAGCFALIAVGFAAAGYGRLTGAAVPDPLTVQSSVSLRFEDVANGGVRAVDPTTGEEVRAYGPGEGGFLRIALRSLASKRIARGGGAEAPFDLIRTPEGLLALHDPVTGDRLALNAFGDDNEGVFAELLELAEARRSS